MHKLRATPTWARTLTGVLLVAAVALAVLMTTHHDNNSALTDNHAQPAGQFTVIAPADGQLTVGSVPVRQLAGSCQSADVCRYANVGSADQPVVTVSAGTKIVPVMAKESSAFSVSAFNVTDPAAPVSVGFARGNLLLDAVKVGQYQVSIHGDRGGVWQFQLKVAKTKK